MNKFFDRFLEENFWYISSDWFLPSFLDDFFYSQSIVFPILDAYLHRLNDALLEILASLLIIVIQMVLGLIDDIF